LSRAAGRCGIRPSLFAGDNHRAAAGSAAERGIHDVCAGLLLQV
jgi:cation transport ATPase